MSIPQKGKRSASRMCRTRSRMLMCPNILVGTPTSATTSLLAILEGRRVLRSNRYSRTTSMTTSRWSVSARWDRAYDSGADRDLLKGSIRLDLLKSKPTRHIVIVGGDIVYDTAVPWEIGVFSNYQERRCGVEFDQPAKDQFRELHSFIKDFDVQEN